MSEMKYAKLVEVAGRWRAELIENFLESEGIDAELFQDTLSHLAYVTTFARVQIFVPKEQIQQAQELLKNFDDLFEGND